MLVSEILASFLCCGAVKQIEIEVSIMIQNYFEMCVLIINPLKPNFGLETLLVN